MNVVGKAQGFSPIGIMGKNEKNYNKHFLKNKMLVPLNISFFEMPDSCTCPTTALKHTSKYTRKSCGCFYILYNFALLNVWTNFSSSN
jgi:hypothetical protein